MEYFDYEIHDSLTARVYYSKLGRQIYFVDDEGNELARVRLVDGLDLFNFSRIIRDEAKSE